MAPTVAGIQISEPPVQIRTWEDLPAATRAMAVMMNFMVRMVRVMITCDDKR
jgi:hypothetical protein